MTTSTTAQYVTFVVGEEIYAVPVGYVREIVRTTHLTKVPLAPEYIEGIANLRGEVLPVMSLRKRLGISHEDVEGSKIVILTSDDRTLGVIVDRTAQVITAGEEQIQESGASSEFVSNVIRADKGSFYLLLDVEKLLSAQEKSMLSKAKTAEGGKKHQESQEQAQQHVQIVTFEMANEVYAFRIEQVQEIIRYSKPTQVPDAPPYVQGVINLRQNVLPIIDLRVLLNLPQSEIDEFTKVIVLRAQGSLTGLVVDRIREVLRLEESQIMPPPSLTQQQEVKEVIGVIRKDEEMIMLLDPAFVISEQVSELAKEAGEEASATQVSTVEEEQYVVFKVGDEEYGVAIEKVREINRISSLTKIPRSPRFLEGLMNLRGEVIPVVDLRKRFELEVRQEKDSAARVIVSEINEKKTGFIVDSVEGVERIPKHSIMDVPDMLLEGESGRFITNVIRVDTRVILVLDIDKLLTTSEMRRMEKVVQKAEGEDSKSQAQKTQKKQGQKSKQKKNLKRSQ